jgi:hypothetical protein
VDAHELREDFDHAAGANAAPDVDGQALPGELVDDGQTFQRLAIRARIEDKVVRPYVVRGRRGQRARPTGRHATPWPATRDLEPRLSPEPMGPIHAQHVPRALQEDPNAAIVVTRILRGQVAHRREYGRITHGQP